TVRRSAASPMTRSCAAAAWRTSTAPAKTGGGSDGPALARCHALAVAVGRAGAGRPGEQVLGHERTRVRPAGASDRGLLEPDPGAQHWRRLQLPVLGRRLAALVLQPAGGAGQRPDGALASAYAAGRLAHGGAAGAGGGRRGRQPDRPPALRLRGGFRRLVLRD